MFWPNRRLVLTILMICTELCVFTECLNSLDDIENDLNKKIAEAKWTKIVENDENWKFAISVSFYISESKQLIYLNYFHRKCYFFFVAI